MSAKEKGKDSSQNLMVSKRVHLSETIADQEYGVTIVNQKCHKLNCRYSAHCCAAIWK